MLCRATRTAASGLHQAGVTDAAMQPRPLTHRPNRPKPPVPAPFGRPCGMALAELPAHIRSLQVLQGEALYLLACKFLDAHTACLHL